MISIEKQLFIATSAVVFVVASVILALIWVDPEPSKTIEKCLKSSVDSSVEAQPSAIALPGQGGISVAGTHYRPSAKKVCEKTIEVENPKHEAWRKRHRGPGLDGL